MRTEAKSLTKFSNKLNFTSESEEFQGELFISLEWMLDFIDGEINYFQAISDNIKVRRRIIYWCCVCEFPAEEELTNVCQRI
jgi:hypothetical protein